MSSANNSSTQFELFPEGSKREFQPPQQGFNPRKIMVSLEQVVGGCIVFIVVGVVCFCMGVKKGQNQRNLAQVELKNLADIPEENAIIVRSDEQKIEVLEIPPVPEEGISLVENSVEENTEVLQIELPPDIPDVSGYTIQVASFEKETSAKKEALNLEKKGFETSIMQKGKHSIVCVGKFSERQDAKLFSKRLKNKYKDCLVRRL